MKFDQKQLMELAISVMEKSISESRTDGKASPRVGSVLWMPDGTITTACRGELRNGDHAEYTLLERKNRDQKLDTAVLFATLEPCAPGARNPPKMSCAERIVDARIKQVWVGIEDPDPAVDRKGLKYLQDNGVEVHMFDRHYQQAILDANSSFISQARERAATAANNYSSNSPTLSCLEEAVAQATTDDFSDEALLLLKDGFGFIEDLNSPQFYHRLKKQGFLKTDSEQQLPTGLGLILFGSRPREFLPQSGLLATLRYPNDTEETRDFDGPLIMIPTQLEQWLKDKLPNVINRSHMVRSTDETLPLTLVREVVVNALVHRDYDIRGAKCQLIISSDSLEIISPGAPVSPIKLDQLQDFSAPMLSRNPKVHFVFAKLGLAEERGLGLRTLSELPKTHDLPLPIFRFKEPYLTLEILRSTKSTSRSLPESIQQLLNADELGGWEFLSKRSSTTTAEYADGLEFNMRKARRHLKKFTETGLLHRVGKGPATRYVIVR